MNVVLDDHLLREVLLDGMPPWLRRRHPQRCFTTGSWYYRLCLAVSGGAVVGALSGPLADVPEDIRRRVLESIARLPREIDILSLRDIGWRTSEVAHRHGLNLLAAEALCVALTTRSAIATAEVNLPARLAAAAAAEGVRVLVSPTMA